MNAIRDRQMVALGRGQVLVEITAMLASAADAAASADRDRLAEDLVANLSALTAWSQMQLASLKREMSVIKALRNGHAHGSA